MSFNNSQGRAEINSDVTDDINHQFEKVELIVPTTGKLFFEHKGELIFCKPHLMPLKSQALERLEEMQRDTARQLMEKRLKTLSKSKNSKTNQ